MKHALFVMLAVIAACGDGNSPLRDGGPGDADRCLACAPHATCDASAAAPCSCPAGYSGDGTLAGTGCTDIDECTAGANNCDPAHGTCTNTAGSFSCGCAAGFAGDGTVSGTGCADIDECTAGTNNCDPAHGTCTNTVGSFTCGCAAGFAGDGTVSGTGCTDIDECMTGANDCDNFTCVNTPGAFHCDGLYAVGPFQGVLARLDPSTFGLLDVVKVTSSGSVSGVTTMVRDPMSSTVYAVAKVSGVPSRGFGTLDLATGAFSVISSVDRFSSLTFTSDGTLWGTTGAGASARKQLFTIDPVTGTPTLFSALGHGADGEVICYDSDADIMYHWTGNGTPLMESFAMAMPLSINSVAGNLGTGEVFGCRYVGNHNFLIYDIQSHVHLVDSAGVVSPVAGAVSALFDDVRATVPDTMVVPHNVRPLSGTSAGGTTVTLRGLGLTGATAVTFGGTAAASFTVVDDTTITAVTPAAAAGTVAISVTTPLPYRASWPGFQFVDPPAPPRPPGATPASQPAASAAAPLSQPGALLRKLLRGR